MLVQTPLFQVSLPRTSPGLTASSTSLDALGQTRFNDTITIRFQGKASLLDSNMELAKFEKLLMNRVRGKNKAESVAELTEVLDRYLQGKWTDQTHPGKRQLAGEALKAMLGERGQGNLVMAQINPTPGDLKNNALKIMNYIRQAEAINADMIVFPELSLMGYPIRDIITRHPSLVEENVKWLKAIAEQTGKTRVVVGFVEPRNPSNPSQPIIGRDFFNALAILGEGKIEGIVRKSLLPNYGEFDDWRVFEPSPATGVHSPETLGSGAWGFETPAEQGKSAKIHGLSYGVTICEDTWNDTAKKLLYKQNPIAEVMTQKPQVLINSSASPTRSRKENLKNTMLGKIADKYSVPYVYVNQVGAIDESSFEGASRVYGLKGKVIARSKSFEEQFQVVNPLTGMGKVYPLKEKLPAPSTKKIPETFDPSYKKDLERTYYTLIQGIRDYFQKRGFTNRAVLGLSGGLDSAVVGTLLADALGPENVLGVRMSSKLTGSDSEVDAKELATNLGIHLVDIPIIEPVEALQKGLDKVRPELDKIWGNSSSLGTTNGNFQARSRAVTLWGIANDYRAMAIATSDKSELYMGYATINGDMSGELAPIADCTKSRVRALARWMNDNRSVQDAIPKRTIEKPPSAELAINPKTGQRLNAEDDLMPYAFLDEIIWRIESKKQSKSPMIKEKFWFEKQAPVSVEQKKAWLDKFFHRMNISRIKWWLAPPTIIVGSNDSNARTNHHQVITAGRINWDGNSLDEMREILTNNGSSKPSEQQAI